MRPADAVVASPHDAAVARAYARAAARVRVEGRTVVQQLIDGDVAAVYLRGSPRLTAAVSLAEVERLFASLLSEAAIGPSLEDRAVALGHGGGAYFGDQRWGERRLRFTVNFGRDGLGLLVEPVQPLPADPRRGMPARVRLRLPFDGLWWVAEAPRPVIGAHHAVASDQRHAYDLAIWRAGGTFRGEGSDNADYWAWGQRVLAPADGTVVSVRDGVPDNRRPGVDTNVREPAGNHVILDLGGGEYALLAHFRNGSVAVRPGQRVRAGELLGRCGNSGNSSEPHLHLHLQDRPVFRPGGAVGLPIRFRSYLADGVPHRLGAPTSGQFVRQAGRVGP
jgi:murein DD-endopeptidase MepM/ murein hydrolase activator NlpD